MTFGEIVKEYFPNASDDEIEYILWERTGYPEFWNIGIDGNTPEECLHTQLKQCRNESWTYKHPVKEV